MDTFERLLLITARQSGARIKSLSASSAIWQDIGIWGDDVDEFAEALQKEFGGAVYGWPWQRFTELHEATLLTAPVWIWRLLTWPFRGRLHPPDKFERLELGHIANVIEAGHWIEP